MFGHDPCAREEGAMKKFLIALVLGFVFMTAGCAMTGATTITMKREKCKQFIPDKNSWCRVTWGNNSGRLQQKIMAPITCGEVTKRLLKSDSYCIIEETLYK